MGPLSAHPAPHFTLAGTIPPRWTTSKSPLRRRHGPRQRADRRRHWHDRRNEARRGTSLERKSNDGEDVQSPPNPIDASRAGGGVFLASHETNGGDQFWAVQDTGAGIPASELEIGRPFHSTKDGGSGLGLAVARAAIAAHGVLIRIESCPGAGTIVSVWLPYRNA